MENGKWRATQLRVLTQIQHQSGATRPTIYYLPLTIYRPLSRTPRTA